jgi:hypothetical protein
MADDAPQIAALKAAEYREQPGLITIGGKPYMTGPKGEHVPLEAVKAKHILEDEMVRRVVGFALPLADQVARFRQHCFDDVDAFVALLMQEHGAKRGGTKGNLTFTTYDGCLKVTVAVADQIVFGAELQVAKTLIDECLVEWSAEGRPEIRAIVDRVFNVEQAGLINRAELFGLLRLEIEDARWVAAMAAIRESMKVIGSKRYVRIHRRAKATDPWEAVSIDVASS